MSVWLEYAIKLYFFSGHKVCAPLRKAGQIIFDTVKPLIRDFSDKKKALSTVGGGEFDERTDGKIEFYIMKNFKKMQSR